MTSLDIAIVGNGIAGAAASLFLGRAEHRIAHFEQSGRDAPGGAGLLLQPPALAVLRAAGLDGEACKIGARVDYLGAHFVASRQTIRLDYSDFDSRTHACGIQRAALMRILQNATGVDVRWGTHIASVDAQAGCMLTAEGERLGPFDVIVAADGVRSTLRAHYPELLIRDRAYQDGAIVCLIDMTDAVFDCAVMQHFVDGTHVSTWPVGALHAGDTRRMTIALRAHSSELHRLASNPRDWQAMLTRIHPALADVVRVQPDPPELLAYTYRDVSTRSYSKDRLVLIGDAAHAMSPQLGLGASHALLDAWYLATCLSEENCAANALRRFDHVRRSDVEADQQFSRLATPFFQSDHRFVSALRERTAVFFGRSDIFKRRVLRALCRIPCEMD